MLTYELHLNSPEGDFTPTNQTQKFRGKSIQSAKIENLQPGVRYSARLVVEDTNGQRSVGDSYDNALAETINGLYKMEIIRHPKRGPWKTIEDVENAALE